jgi:Spy/CpxP family protein refolding chaperone
MEMLSNRLNLTEDQKTKIKPILDEGTEKIRAIHEETQAKIKAVKEGIHDKIKPLLNPDQQQKLEQFKKEMENRPHPGGFGPGMPGRGFGKNAEGGPGPGMGGNLAEHLAKQLNLTAEQQNQLKPVFEETQAKMKEVWADTSLSMEQKHAKGKEIREANRAKIEAVLTPEQKQKFESLRPQRGPGHEE